MEIFSRKDYVPIPKDGKCVFCGVDIKNIVWKGKYWFILHNKYPYYGLAQHLLVIPYEHKIFTMELSPEEMVEFIEVEKFMNTYYSGGDYFSFIRQSNSIKSRSVAHLHYHYLPGCIDADDIEEFLGRQFN